MNLTEQVAAGNSTEPAVKHGVGSKLNKIADLAYLFTTASAKDSQTVYCVGGPPSVHDCKCNTASVAVSQQGHRLSGATQNALSTLHSLKFWGRVTGVEEQAASPAAAADCGLGAPALCLDTVRVQQQLAAATRQ